ncbi:MAG: metal ABC transporter permease [Acidihalobacter sp.]|uniref:metal ABC transporter permease n=1 Tax=Acidihalobacter sp. TaxID=1872108 RepID=UPI00307DCBAC
MILGLEYAFMRHALAAGTAISVVAASVGYFVTLRRQAFAAHALSHVGFTGAAGAILLGLSPYLGLFAATLLVALGLAWSGRRLSERDVGVGMLLMFSLGLGVLFLNLYTTNATAAMNILFGSIVAVTAGQAWLSVGVAAVVLLGLGLIVRPLLFMSLNEEAAAGRGVPVGLLHTVFLILLALTAAIAVPIIGALLIFALLVGPPAAAQALNKGAYSGLVIAVAMGVLETWGGIACSYYIGYPASTWIATLSFVVYASTKIIERLSRGRSVVG